MITKVDLEKVKVFGRDYILTFLINEWNNMKIEESYRIYVTDSLRVLMATQTNEMEQRWIDFIEDMKNTKPKLKPENVINSMKQKMARMLGGD